MWIGSVSSFGIVAIVATSDSIVIRVHDVFDSDDSGLPNPPDHQSIWNEFLDTFKREELVFFQPTNQSTNHMWKAERYVGQDSGPENTIVRDKAQTWRRETHGCSCQVTFLLF